MFVTLILLAIIKMSNQKKHFRLFFIFSVITLLLNDHFLKDFYGNYFTGKLSDFAGLFAFPYFLCLLFPNKIKFNYIFSGLFFIFWKSHLIEPLLNYLQSVGLGVYRTIDYSDLVALIMLPISYIYWYSNFNDYISVHKSLKPILMFIFGFAFIATSTPKQYGNLNLKSDLEVRLKKDKQSVISILNLSKNRNLYDFEFFFPKYHATVYATIQIDSLENGLINVKLDSILNFKVGGGFFSGVNKDDVIYIKKLQNRDFEKIFLEKEITKLYQKIE